MTLIGINSSEIASAVVGIFAVGLVLVIYAWARGNRHHDLAVHRPQTPDRIVAKLSSKGLSAIIVQALVDSKIIPPEKVDEAVVIAARKIDLRKACGDY